MKEQVLLVAASTLYKKRGDEITWFLVKNKADGDWEIPKTIARTGESSVRASVRSMGEQGGMRIKVLEEVGRHGGAAKVNNKVMTQRVIYYLMVHKDGDEVLGFVESGWFDYSAALRKLSTKRDKDMLKSANILQVEVRERKRKKLAAVAAAN